MGLVKVAFLWELLNIGFHVLISDLVSEQAARTCAGARATPCLLAP